jgi:hypothetical protein
MTTPSNVKREAGDPSRTRLLWHGVSVLLLSAYPLSLILRANLGVVPLGAGTILWILALDFSIAAALFVLLRLLTADIAGRAAWLGVFFLCFGTYSVVLQITNALGWPLLPERPTVAIGYTLTAALIATIAVRPWQHRRRDPVPLLIVGVVLVGTNAVVGLSRAVTFSSTGTGRGPGWQTAADTLIAQTTSGPLRSSAGATRDIYYIILDGFGRSDTLARVYDLDLTEFVTYLTAKGFYVGAKAQSNYAQTYLSLAGTLNLSYLDEVVSAIGPRHADRTALSYLIDRNALMTLARRAGYHVVGIGSDYLATEYLANADVCKCDQYGSSETEQAIFASTPLIALSLGPRAFGAHRRKILQSFDDLEAIPASGRRSFVFAHIVAPHPPFVFNADGTASPTSGLFMFQDGSHFPGSREEYRQGYRRQTQFIVARLQRLIDDLTSRPGPAPVIVIHGDHGPGLALDWTSAARTDLSERMSIFAAYYLPGAREQPYATMTPINGARLLANEYFGTSLPRIDDRSFFSTWLQPFDLVDSATSTTPEQHR